MIENKKQMNESNTRDYRERFEFKLSVGNDIYCQRYFKINNFNPRSLKSFELADTIRSCAAIIDEDLKSKTRAYLEVFAPMYFDSLEQMNEFFSKESNANRMRPGLGIVVKGLDHDYVWGKNNAPAPCNFKFDDGELNSTLTDDDRVTYKFAFYVDGREVCSTIWEGVYPKYVRNSIDLANKRGKLGAGDDVNRLNFEQYLDYKVVEGRSDLIYGLIKEICHTCSDADNSMYTTKTTVEPKDEDGESNFNYFGSIKYNNYPDYSLWVYPDGKLKPFKKK